MFKFFSAAALLTLAILTTVSCKDETSDVDFTANADCSTITTSQNTYTNNIKAILDASCATSGCHDATTKEEGIDLSTYATSKSAFENSEVLCSIHHGSGCEPMPDGGAQLPAATINLIDCWVKNGYLQ
jgi:hypothetical protein